LNFVELQGEKYLFLRSTKAGIGRKAGHKKRVFMQIFSKIASEKKIPGRSR
jgi:hypothetical protein